MSYRVVRITELMAYEFAQVEGAFNELSEQALQSVIPSGMRFNAFIDQLKEGHLVLLNDPPTTPMLLRESASIAGEKTWALNAQVSDNIGPTAQKALLARTQIRGRASRVTRSLHPPLPMPAYIPEPPIVERYEPPKLNYEYSFEIACAHESSNTSGNTSFVLGKTKSEGVLDRWSEVKTKYGTRYTVKAAFDEPKQLLAQVASVAMGISLFDGVKVRGIGSQVANDGFIPISPAVQIGERLGFPTEGFFYHFHDKKLIQEYRIIGDNRWGFYATTSKHERLNSERGYNTDQTTMFVYWKVDGKIVDDQYLIYLEQQISREQLDNLNDEWLSEHGVKLDIPQLLETIKAPIAHRAQVARPKETNEVEPTTHVVKIDSETGQRESWSKIATQYGIAPKQLLSLNPQFDADPMTLSVGDTLIVKQSLQSIEKEPIYGLPPKSPKVFNHPLNSYYDYSARCIMDSSVVALGNKRMLQKDVPIVNVKALSTASKATDYGKLAFLALPANTANVNLGLISTNTSSTLGGWSISGEALSGFARIGGGLVAALWPSQLGDGTLDGNPELAASDTTAIRVRFNMYTDENGKQQVVGIKTGEGSAYGDRVAKREAVQHGQHFVAELDSGITITWTPDGSTDVLTPDTVLPENDQLDVHNIWVRPIEEHEQEIGTILYPEEDLAEYIVTFPTDAGLPPLYLVFRKTARDESGVVTGDGEDITGIWLEKAGEGLGVPIPSQIADKLRGKEFSSFDAFRKTFWKAISETELSAQFTPSNQELIRQGFAPFARFKDQVGGRQKYEIHHKIELQHGGGVYELDNMAITTPQNHIRIHSKSKG